MLLIYGTLFNTDKQKVISVIVFYILSIDEAITYLEGHLMFYKANNESVNWGNNF